MPDLRTASNAMQVIVFFVVVLLLGDYLGYKMGRWRLAATAGIVTLAIVIAFAIYAVIWLR